MPTYEYRCDNCEHQFERFQSIKAKPLRKCPKCGRSTLNRLIGTGAGVIFKGSGFYQTDYRSDGYKKALEKETGTDREKKDDKKSEAAKTEKSQAKPAAESTFTKGEKKSV